MINNQRVQVSRRGFLCRSSLLIGGVLAAPSLAHASAVARNGKAPSERVRMAFIGLGGQGTGHLLGGAWTYVPGGYVAREDVQIMAVCDVRRDRREHARNRCNTVYADKTGQGSYTGVTAYNDFREVLARQDIDAVLLALPYHWAAPMSVMAMRAGKDVYCEKPIAITVGEGSALIETAQRYGRVYQAGMQQRSEYGGKFRLACELVRNGRIGNLKEVYAYRQPGAFNPLVWATERPVPVPDGFDWDLWLGPLPWRPFAGHAGHALPGLFTGDVNWAPHHYDIIQWTVNADPSAPIEVECENQGKGQEPVVHYRYANGVVVHSSPYPGEPVGNEGGACFVGTDGRIAVDRNSIVSDPSNIVRAALRPGDERVYRADSHSSNFLECVRSRAKTICDPVTAVYTMNAILIGGVSMIVGRKLKWDPAKLRFEGDPEANRYLSYAARAPWVI
jgi:predicted dehydrogenase